MDPINENRYKSYNDHHPPYLQSPYPSIPSPPSAQNYPHDHATQLSHSPSRCNCPSPVYPEQIHVHRIHANSYDKRYNYFSQNHKPSHTAHPHGSTTSHHPDSTWLDSRTQKYEADCRSSVGYCSR